MITYVYQCKNKIKVKYVAKISNKSLAAALATNEQMLGKSARDTAEFLSKFDDIFDVNNSRLTNIKSLHTAILDNNCHLDFIIDSIK